MNIRQRSPVVSRCLVVVTRVPSRNGAKTRLAAGIGPDACAQLQWAFLADVVGWAGQLAPHRVLSVFPPRHAGELAVHAPGWALSPQPEGDFGERMRGAVNAGFVAGEGPVAMIATDSPTLPARVLEQGWAAVAGGDADVALAPADDGGWVMIAAAAPLPARAFAGVRWSCADTLADTEAALARAGLRAVRTGEGWYDVDTAAELARLCRELRVPGAAARLPCTTAALQRFGLFMDGAHSRR